MAKVTLPDNYSEMSPEERLKFFESYEYDDKSTELEKAQKDLERYKTAITNANAEAKKYKDERNALMSEDERNKQANEEALKALQTELESLRRDKTLSEYKAQFLGIGYDSTLAEETAAALASGEYTKVFQNQKAFLDAQIKLAESNALKNQTTLTAGATPKPQTAEDEYKASILKAAGVS